MRWVGLFEDREDGAAIRNAHAEAHRAFLRRHKGVIQLAGAMRDEPDGQPFGGMWLFEADSRAEVEAIIAEDPYVKAGLRASMRIVAWGTAPGFEDMVVGSRG